MGPRGIEPFPDRSKSAQAHTRRGAVRRLLDPYVRWNWAWNADAAIRYMAVGDRIRDLTLHGQALRICDVGCGSKGGLSTYVRLPVVGVDLAFDPDDAHRFQLCSPVVGSGHALPFATASFHVVVCVDVLEHVPAERRPGIIDELFRVAGEHGQILVGAPCGAAIREMEIRQNERYRQRTGGDHPWLGEHLANEVLACEQMQEWLASAAGDRFGRYSVTAIPNMGLRAWRIVSAMWQHPLLMHVQRALFQPWVRWLRRCSGPPSYRWIWHVRALRSSDESGD